MFACVCVSICLSVRVSAFTCVSVCGCVSLYICQSLHMSLSVGVSVCLSVRVSMHVCILAVTSSTLQLHIINAYSHYNISLTLLSLWLKSLSTYHVFIQLLHNYIETSPVYSLSVRLSVSLCLSVCVSVRLSVHLSVLHLSVCLFMCPSLRVSVCLTQSCDCLSISLFSCPSMFCVAVHTCVIDIVIIIQRVSVMDHSVVRGNSNKKHLLIIPRLP